MKKTFLYFAAAFLAVSANMKAWDFKSGDLYYNILDFRTVEVTYENDPESRMVDESYNNLRGEVTIPSTVNYNGDTYKVVGIGDRAFMCPIIPQQEGGAKITKVVFEEPCNVEYIGDYAFRYNQMMETFKTPQSVTQMGKSVFESTNVKNVVLSNSITEMNEATMLGADELEVCVLPAHLEVIGNEKDYKRILKGK